MGSRRTRGVRAGLGIVTAFNAIFFACGDDKPTSDAATKPPTKRAVPPVKSPPRVHHPPNEEGRALYAQHCALCHGANGEGYKADHANALGNQDFLQIASDGFLRVAIAEGRPGTPMSAWSSRHGGPFTDAQIANIVRHIRSWQTEPTLPTRPARVMGDANLGKTLFAEKCASCHGSAGEGATALSLNSPWFLSITGDGYLKQTILRGRRGTPMVSFASILSEVDVDHIVALIRTWEQRPNQRESEAHPEPLRFRQPIIHPRGRAPEFTLRDERFVSADAVKQAMDAGRRMVILDARPPSDFLQEHIRGAISMPFYAVDALVGTLPKDGTWIIAYCACPHAASGQVIGALRERGFTHTAILDEGMPYWKNKHYPVRSGNTR